MAMGERPDSPLPAHEPPQHDIVVERVEEAWRKLASCRSLADDGTSDEIAGAMDWLDYTARIARRLPLESQQTWLEGFDDIDQLVQAIHTHLRTASIDRDE